MINLYAQDILKNWHDGNHELSTEHENLSVAEQENSHWINKENNYAYCLCTKVFVNWLPNDVCWPDKVNITWVYDDINGVRFCTVKLIAQLHLIKSDTLFMR